MITVTVNYIVYTPGHRHHHAGSQTNIIPPVSGTASPGDSFPVTAFPSLKYNGNDLPFGFISATGGANGSELFTAPGTQNIPVSTSDINVLVIYAPAGGGPGGPQVWVDAFNVDIGDFSDSDFMSVYSNGILDNPKTATANDDGIVTSESAEDLRSYASVDNVPFLEWFKMDVSNPVKTIDYNLQTNENGFVFAFYKSPKSVVTIPVNVVEGPIYVAPGVAVEYKGITGSYGELTARLMSTVAFLSISSVIDSSLKNQVIELTINNLMAIAESIKSSNLNESKN